MMQKNNPQHSSMHNKNNYERKKLIKDLLSENEYLSVKSIAKLIYASQATVRRELNALQAEGIVKRTRGGATLAADTQEEWAFEARDNIMKSEKRSIAAACAKFIKNGSSVFLDSSSTAGNVIPFLSAKEGVTVVTNGVKTALLASKYKNIEVFVLGGKLLSYSNSIVGSKTISEILNYRFDYALLSASGLDQTGVFTDNNAEQAQIKRAVPERSTNVFMLVDSSKVGSTYMNVTLPSQKVTAVFCDRELPLDIKRVFDEHSVQVIISDKTAKNPSISS